MSDGTQTLPAKWRPVTEESRPVRIALIAAALAGLAVLVLAPLVVVFAEALAQKAEDQLEG